MEEKKKKSSRKSLRTLFSRTEPGPDDSAQKQQDRKKFKFPKLKMKTKMEAERQQEVRTPGDEDRPASLKKASSVCATESRSKVRLFSYSDLDLRSPRRFASFSFGLRKRRRRDEEDLSRSAFGLHSNQQEEEEENPVSRLDLDRADPKTRFSLSQPELDTSGTFNIPSPPPPSSNRAEPSSFTAGLLTRTRPEPEELLSNRTSRTLIASNPEFPVPTVRKAPAVPGLRSNQAEPGADQKLTSSAASGKGDGSDGPTPVPEPHGTSGLRTLVLEQRTGSSTRDSGSTLGEPEPEEALTLSTIPEPEPRSSEPKPTVPGEGKLDRKVPVELSELDPAVPAAPAKGCDPEPAVPVESSALDLMVPAVSAAGSDPEPDAAVPPHSPGPGSGRDSVFGTLYKSLSPRFFLVRSPDRVPEPEPPGVQTLPLVSPDLGAGFSGSAETTPSRVIRVRTASHSGGLVPASPVTAASPGTDSRVSGSERRLVPVGRQIAADCLPPDHGMNVQDFSEPPEPDRALSPVYLSVGSDDGTELYFSAPEETPESGEEADLRDGWGEVETPKGQRSEAKAETASAQVRVWEEPAPPVPQVNRLQECGSAPPAVGAPVEGNQAAETEDPAQKAPNLPGPVLVSDPRRTEETREELRVRPRGEEEEEGGEERTFTRPDSAAGRPEGAGTRTRRVNGAATTQRQVPDLTSALDARRPPGDPHPARAAADLDRSCQPTEPEPEPDDRMSSGYSSLSTTLTLKNPSPPREEEPKPRFHKVSLVTMETSSMPEPDDPEPEYKWKNRFQGVTQFKSSRSPLPEDDEPSSHFSSSDSSVYLSPAGGGEWRRSLLEGEESAAPAGEEDERLKGETEWRKPSWELEPLSASSCSTEDNDSFFTGVFKATLVDLTPDPPTSPDSPTSPNVDSPINDMDSLVDTLRSMGPSQRPRSTGVRAAPPPLVSTLSPIREDTGSPVISTLPPIREDTGSPVISTLSPIREDTGSPVISTLSPIREDTGSPVISTLPPIREDTGSPVISTLSPIREDMGSPFVRSTPQMTEEPQNQLYTLPLDLGLKRNISRDARSPMELMKSQELTSSLHNGNGTPSSPTTGSRLDNSVLFGSYRSSNSDLKLENGTAHRPLFSSLPDTGTLGMRLRETGEAGPVGDVAGSRLERLSFLVNSSSSLNGDAGPSRISRSSSLILGSPTSNSPTHLLSPTGSIDPHRAPTISEPHLFSQGPRVLQRSLSYEGLSQASLFSSLSGGPQFSSLSGGPQFSSLSGGPQFSSLSGGPQFSSLSGGPQFSSLSGGPQFSSLSGGPQFSSLSGGPQLSSLSGGPQLSSLSGGPQLSSLSGGPQFSSLSGGPQFSSLSGGPQFSSLSGGPQFSSLSGGPQFSSLSGGPQLSSLSGGPQLSSLSGGPQLSSLSGGPQLSSLSGGPQFSSLSGGPQLSSLSGGPQFSSLSGGPQFSSLSGGPQLSSLSGGPQLSSLSGGPQLSSLSGGPQLSSVQAGSQFNSVHRGSQLQNQRDEPDSNLMSKYRAFPDAYLTKEKEHGKLNPRPGKIYIFDRPGMCGRRMEIRGDVMDATSWELQDTISIRVVRGGWVLYEKPNFKGEKIALDEGDVELTCPFSPPEEALRNGQEEEKKNGETEEQSEEKPAQKFIIGSIRRAVRDYSVPEIGLFPEENAEGKKVVFRDTAEDARIFGFPIKANSIIVNAGLWLVFAQPFFQGIPRILEVGGYSNPAAWGVEQPYVGSVHPLKVGEPRVENMSEPKMVIYEKPYFSGKSRTISSNMRDFMSRTDRQQNLFMASLGSLKVLGGIWVGYEKEGFRGHQYLLEEGEYHDWRVWGGCDSELRSVRIIRADLTDPVMVMFEQPEEEQGVTEEKTFEVTEAIPDVELFDYKTSTRSIHVLSGAWIAYSHVDFSGNQYILEKGFYNNCADWGSQDTRVCSVQPILPAPAESSGPRDEIILYSEPDFQGDCLVFHHSQGALSEKFLTRSCRVVRGSWVLCENKQFSGNMHVLSEEDYPNLTSMGCPSCCAVLSIKLVPMTLSVPSVSLFGLEGLEGREITTESEVTSLVQDGFNDHILSVRVNSGCWVLCEHSNYRGRQFLLEPIEITNWPKFSSLDRVGSMYPVRQKRHFFRVKNKESGHFLSVQGGVEELKSGRVVAAAEVEPLSDIWFYQEGRIKNKLSPSMCLQVMGSVEPAAKVVLWNESRQPIQNWSAKMQGPIGSLTFPGMVLDVKGGRTYDKEHVVVMPENDERLSQQWEIQLL